MSCSTSTTTKSLRIVEEQNTVHVFDALISDDLWCTGEEHYESRRSLKAHTIKLRREGVDRLVESTFANPAADTQKLLNDFTRHSDGRGLERLTSQQHYEERMSQRALAIKAILMGQQEARDRGLQLCDVTEQLRELSLRYCCTAKIFARRMGKADEYACYKKSKSISCDVNSTGSTSKKSSKSKSKKEASSSKSSKSNKGQLSASLAKQCSSRRLVTSASARSLAIAA
ncbi:expressed unknown protein [Seminavis robusta]|uniref:Uncharacterized protein n=1 Tax=Seminavis robusta TaxID=568900 RepID=A0A9N8DZ38_9STRA|nr:expressed unknown protein [Seminavis robusta]|eukprot:Sro489_g153200.1 n/a (229) ;mRNA; r:4956-5642